MLQVSAVSPRGQEASTPFLLCVVQTGQAGDRLPATMVDVQQSVPGSQTGGHAWAPVELEE